MLKKHLILVNYSKNNICKKADYSLYLKNKLQK
jgi:hypothetical protein